MPLRTKNDSKRYDHEEYSIAIIKDKRITLLTETMALKLRK